MAGYNWEAIFKNKTEKELIEIYSGKSQLNFEAEIFAGLELKNRDYDFQKIEDIHKRKIEELKIEIEDFENLEFRKSKYFRDQIMYGIGIVVLIILLITNQKPIFEKEIYHYYKAAFYLFFTLIAFLTARWNFERFKKNKKKMIIEKTELLNKITRKKVLYTSESI